jgi:5'-nucleotidase
MPLHATVQPGHGRGNDPHPSPGRASGPGANTAGPGAAIAVVAGVGTVGVMTHPLFVLGVDLDGVVADYVAGFRRFLVETTGRDPGSLPDPERWSFVESGWFGSDADYLTTHARAVTEWGLFRKLPMITGAAASLQRLSDAGVYIKVITHRLVVNRCHQVAVADTVDWLDDAAIPYRDILFTADKATIAGLDVLIDDAPHNIEAVRAAMSRRGQGEAVVMDHAYNRHLDGPRVTCWAELEARVLTTLEARAV